MVAQPLYSSPIGEAEPQGPSLGPSPPRRENRGVFDPHGQRTMLIVSAASRQPPVADSSCFSVKVGDRQRIVRANILHPIAMTVALSAYEQLRKK
jgi:hypothetical protein